VSDVKLQIGTAPDSWGVWFPSDPRQIAWERFLDEVVEAGYEWLELGPYGYLPTDPTRLRRELEGRGLHLAGGTVIGSLHDPEAYPAVHEAFLRTAELTASLDGRFLVLIDEMYRDPVSGEQLSPANLDRAAWQRLIETTNDFGRFARDRFDLRLVFHSHADSHVERAEQLEAFMAQTDPQLVALCLDTGHFEYRGGDSVQFMGQHHPRIPYLHLKNVDPATRAAILRDDLPFGEAVAMGVFCEPDRGTVSFQALARLLAEIEYQGWAIVEQDMYPCDFDKPLPIAKRTRSFLRSIGLG
jgi:inosose dehydratase